MRTINPTITEASQSIDELINEYGDKKKQLDVLKKAVDKVNATIKSMMYELDTDSYSTDKYTVKCTQSERKTLDEDKLLSLLHDTGYTNLIKTREYVDFEELERALYAGAIDADTVNALTQCENIKTVTTLTIKEKK